MSPRALDQRRHGGTGEPQAASDEGAKEGIRRELVEFLDGWLKWPTYREFQRRGKKGLRDRITKHGGARYWAREVGVRYVRHRPGYAPVWTDERIRAELADFLAGRDVWPKRKEFEQTGKKLLRDAILRTGGPERWAAEFGLPRSSERSGSRRVWTDERIEAQLRGFLGDRTDWPPRRDFIAAGRGALLSAAYRWGGPEHWADRLGVTRPKRKAPPARWVWTEERIRSELATFCAGRDRWPRYAEFVAAGEQRLYRAASLRGGIHRWIKELGLSK